MTVLTVTIPVHVADTMEFECRSNTMFCCSCGENVQGDGEDLNLHGSTLMQVLTAAASHRCT
jgi:hypothetical protein